jgi:glycine/D-amino acid oxidase-like deaminating enzyme
MKLTGGDPFWSVRNGLLATYPPLDGDLTCDVAVIGGGITGALVAFHLAQAGVSTAIFDKRDIGSGSTCGSTGLLQYEVDVPLRQLVKQVGTRRAGRSYLLCRDAVQKICRLVNKFDLRCELRSRPSLFLARSEDEIVDLQEEHRLRKSLGIPVDFWDRHQIEKRYPFSRPAALFSEEGAEVDPHRFAQGLLSAANEKRLRIFDRTNVTNFLPNRRGIDLVTETGHTVRARRVVIAAGFESQKYLARQYGQLKSTYALISEPIPNLRDWYRRSLIWETGTPYLYLRTTGENRIIVGGEDVEIANPVYRDRLILAKTRVLQRKFKKLFPEIKLEAAFRWAGTFSSTKDGLAYIGTHQSLPHAYFAMGYGGNGITYSLIAAEIIRDHFLGRRNPNGTLFSFYR